MDAANALGRTHGFFFVFFVFICAPLSCCCPVGFQSAWPLPLQPPSRRGLMTKDFPPILTPFLWLLPRAFSDISGMPRKSVLGRNITVKGLRPRGQCLGHRWLSRSHGETKPFSGERLTLRFALFSFFSVFTCPTRPRQRVQVNTCAIFDLLRPKWRNKLTRRS